MSVVKAVCLIQAIVFADVAAAAVVVEVQGPKVSRPLTNGVLAVDFGRDAFGWLETCLPEGDYVVRIGEKLAGDGRVDMKPGGTIRAAEVKFRASGSGFMRIPFVADERNTAGRNGKTHAVAIPEKYGVIMPFRYVEILNAPGQVGASSVRRHILHWNVNMDAASFICSEERLDRVYEFCKYSILATSFAGVYVDGDRERIPYEADAYINQLGHYAIDADFEMARRTFDFLMDHPTWPTEWAQHMIMMAWADWMYSGSTALLERHYQRLKDEKLLLSRSREDCLVVSFPDHSRSGKRDIVDWPPTERDGFAFKPVNAVINAFHYRNLLEMRDIAEALGKTDEAAFFADRAVKVRDSFGRVFFMPDTGLYADGEGTSHASLHANVAALAFGLVPDGGKSKVVDFLVSKGMACSVYFAQYLLDALFDVGRAADAISLMTSDSDRSWLGMMAQGSTITMEAWSLKAKKNQDWNHAWGTPPLNVISRHVLGVTPLKPGFGEISIRPQIGDLKFVRGKVPTCAGTVYVEATPEKLVFSSPSPVKAVFGSRVQTFKAGSHEVVR